MERRGAVPRGGAGMLASLLLLVGGVAWTPATAAGGADFSPTIDWDFCKAAKQEECVPQHRAGAVPRVEIVVEQDAGEDDFAEMIVRWPRGYYLARDRAIEDGTLLGTADATLGTGPGCAGGEGTVPLTAENLPIRERDRTDEEKEGGLSAVWVIEIAPDTNITLLISGNRRKGYRIDHMIPANDLVCPPLRVAVHYQARTEDGEAIIANPKKPGTYTLRAVFKSEDEPRQVQRRSERVVIEK